MVTAGRILHHLGQRLADPRHTVLFVGYQAEGTRGRAMVERAPSVKIHGRHVDIKAHIENLSGLSGHADYHEIMAWLMGTNRAPERIFIVHGEQKSSEAMAEKITSHFKWDVTVPELNDTVEIDL
jgi:metallo-beta-lactamase family protein